MDLHPEVTTLRAAIRRRAFDHPDDLALLAPGRPALGYGGLAGQLSQIGEALAARGLGPTSSVGLAHPDGPETAVAFLGIAGQTSCAPLNPTFTQPEFEFEIDDLELAAIVTGTGDRELPAAVAAAEARGIALLRIAADDDRPAGCLALSGPSVGAEVPLAPDDPDAVALVLHTSGTTARPKIVPLTHRNVFASARAVATSLALEPADRVCNVMPLFHIHGLIAGLSASLSSGASVIATPGFRAGEMLRWMRDHGATWYTAVPTMHQALLDRVARFPDEAADVNVRLIRSSSASLAPTVMADLEATFGAPVIEAYGMTEAAHQMTSNPLPPALRKPGSVGPAAGPRVAVMDETGTILEPDAIGEVVIAGPSVMTGYRGNPEATEAAFTDGWFRTGDQGRIDQDGHLTLTGRLKEMINRGGESISPREIDEALLVHADVAQAVTFAVPDRRLGEQIAAAVVPRPGADLDERTIRHHASERLAPAKVPRRVMFVDELPKGPSGKLQRIGLAERLGLSDLDGNGGPVTEVAPATPAERFLAEMWTAVLGVGDLSIHDHFLDVGGDSLAATRLLGMVRDEIDIEVSILDFFDAPTIVEQGALVSRLLLESDGGT